VGRVWPRHGHRGRPLNSVVRLHENQRGSFFRASFGVGERSRLRAARHSRQLVKLRRCCSGFVSRLLGQWLAEPSEFRAWAKSRVYAVARFPTIAGSASRRELCQHRQTGGFGTCNLTTRSSGPWGMVGRVWPRHGGGGRPLNSVVRRHANSVSLGSALRNCGIGGIRGRRIRNHRQHLSNRSREALPQGSLYDRDTVQVQA
jgi:hypothetical protein